jgi:hypothetical protein
LDFGLALLPLSPCHFEARGREIPVKQQQEGYWLDKIDFCLPTLPGQDFG